MKKLLFILLAILPMMCYAQDANDFQKMKASAEKGNAEDQYLLGLCYYDGIGVEKDEKLAKSLLEKAARQGDKEAAAFLEELFP
ncbi:MAG: SEL1-like repeat protein [Prevotella sp.]|nr:SEL1-like repeat protein [Prevotella sp.]